MALGHLLLKVKVPLNCFVDCTTVYNMVSTNGARSSFLTVTAVMAGGTQLVEGAHLTGGKRFCRESSKSRGFYVGGVKTKYCAENKHERLS